MSILLLDNYDSFTYNLLHYLAELGAETEVIRNDALSVDDIRKRQPQGILISPGPGRPEESGVCPEVIRTLGSIIPIFGVCLGHQAIGMVYGGTVKRAPVPMHGKTSKISHQGEGIFRGLPSPFTATRYHSLIVSQEALPACLEITARSDDGLIMGLQHREHPVYGVQFHPESIASEYGHDLLNNFLTLTRR